MTDYLRPVPASFRGDRDAALFLEQIRTRLRDAGSGQPGLVRRAAAQPDSAAASVDALRADFNALLAALRAAGIVEP